jgi:hypothetical protein
MDRSRNSTQCALPGPKPIQTDRHAHVPSRIEPAPCKKPPGVLCKRSQHPRVHVVHGPERPVVFRTRAKGCETSSSPAPSTNDSSRAQGLWHCIAARWRQANVRRRRYLHWLLSARFSPLPFFNSTNKSRVQTKGRVLACSGGVLPHAPALPAPVTQVAGRSVLAMIQIITTTKPNQEPIE